MQKNIVTRLILILAFLISVFIIILKIQISRYIPIVFMLMFYPYLIYKWISLIFESSSYIKNHHIDFYNKYKSFTNSLDGKVVSITAISQVELEKLNDPKVLIFKSDIKRNRNLMLFCFLSFMLLAFLTVALA